MLAMDKEIAILNDQITKSINEIAKDFEIKYRDFVPSFLGLADCQQKIQDTIKTSNRQLEELKKEISVLEEEVAKAKEEAPLKKQEVIQEFIDKMEILSQMERFLSQMDMHPVTGSGKDTDPIYNVRILLELEKLMKQLESNAANNLEAINDRILPLLFMEIKDKKCELIGQMNDFYKCFVNFSDNNCVSPPTLIMTICVPNHKIACDCFFAMQHLGILEEHLESFCDAIWEQFCTKLIFGEEAAEQIVKIDTSKFAEHIWSFEVKKEVQTTKKPDPAKVFSGLTKFFDELEQALRCIRLEDRFLVDLIGQNLEERLITALEKGCLNPAIPFEKKKGAAKYAELTQMTQDFLQTMKELGFFTQPVDKFFSAFFESFERISVDRRCHHYITTARDLIKQPYTELVEVGSATDRVDEKSEEINAKMQDRMKISAEDADLTTNTHWDKYRTKPFQFQRCKISQSTFKLINLLLDMLRTAAESDSDLEACRLVTTVRNILEMFANTAPEYHKKALTSVPQIAAVFFNNCHYICHRLMTLPMDVVQSIMKVSKISQQDCSFTDMFSQLRQLADATLETHIVHSRRQLSSTIGDRDIFVELRDDNTQKRCQKTLQACVLQIEQTTNVWSEVMSSNVLSQTVGALVSHFLALLTEIILRKEDVTSSDAEITADLLDLQVDKLKQIMTIDGKPMIQKVCEEPFYQLNEIVFCLRSNLAEIGHRWCEGKGPLATWLKAVQVKQLVRAIFQNTERRALLLAQIN